MTIERLRQFIESLLRVREGMTDEQALTETALFATWKPDTAYQTGDRVQYESNLYKCLQAHTSQADWIPSTAVSLWVQVADPSIEYPEWIQPAGAHDAYMTGDKVSHNGKHWVSDVDANIWEPSVYGWTEV